MPFGNTRESLNVFRKSEGGSPPDIKPFREPPPPKPARTVQRGRAGNQPPTLGLGATRSSAVTLNQQRIPGRAQTPGLTMRQNLVKGGQAAIARQPVAAPRKASTIQKSPTEQIQLPNTGMETPMVKNPNNPQTRALERRVYRRP